MFTKYLSSPTPHTQYWCTLMFTKYTPQTHCQTCRFFFGWGAGSVTIQLKSYHLSFWMAQHSGTTKPTVLVVGVVVHMGILWTLTQNHSDATDLLNVQDWSCMCVCRWIYTTWSTLCFRVCVSIVEGVGGNCGVVAIVCMKGIFPVVTFPTDSNRTTDKHQPSRSVLF